MLYLTGYVMVVQVAAGRGESSRPHPPPGTDGTDGIDAFSARLDNEHIQGRAVLGGLPRDDQLHVADAHVDQGSYLRRQFLTAGLGRDEVGHLVLECSGSDRVRLVGSLPCQHDGGVVLSHRIAGLQLLQPCDGVGSAQGQQAIPAEPRPRIEVTERQTRTGVLQAVTDDGQHFVEDRATVGRDLVEEASRHLPRLRVPGPGIQLDEQEAGDQVFAQLNPVAGDDDEAPAVGGDDRPDRVVQPTGRTRNS